MIVYIARSPSDKVYIGITSKTLSARINGHEKQSKVTPHYKFYKAIKKYGIENFIWGILHEEVSFEKACELEKYYIEICDSKNNGYNITSGGEGTPGNIWNDRQRLKGSIAQKKRFENDLEKKKASNAWIKWMNEHPEEYKKILEKRRITQSSVEYKNKVSVRMKEIYKDKNIVEKLKKLRAEAYKNNPELGIEASRKRGGKPVLVYDLNNKFIKRYETAAECCRSLHVGTGNLHLVLNGKRKTSNGYIFKHYTGPS